MAEEKQSEEIARMPLPSGRQTIGIVEARLGGNKLRVVCQDGKTRVCRIPGKYRSKLWIKEGDVVLVEPWEIQGDERGDVIFQYSKAQIEWLRKKGMLTL